MRDHKGDIKGYHRGNKAYYSDVIKGIEITIGLYAEDGSTSGEFGVKWVKVGGRLCARLEIFEDSWSTLSQLPDLVKALGNIDGDNIQEDEFAMILDELGFKDLTSYKAPYELDEEIITVKMPKWKAEKLDLL